LEELKKSEEIFSGMDEAQYETNDEATVRVQRIEIQRVEGSYPFFFCFVT
jgi:hypothetical protein